MSRPPPLISHTPFHASSSVIAMPDPEYIAIILAATQGSRLFPLTSEYPGLPKHLLPCSPLTLSTNDTSGLSTPLQRLLLKTHEAGFQRTIVAIHGEDTLTIPYLKNLYVVKSESSDTIDLEYRNTTIITRVAAVSV